VTWSLSSLHSFPFVLPRCPALIFPMSPNFSPPRAPFLLPPSFLSYPFLFLFRIFSFISHYPSWGPFAPSLSSFLSLQIQLEVWGALKLPQGLSGSGAEIIQRACAVVATSDVEADNPWGGAPADFWRWGRSSPSSPRSRRPDCVMRRTTLRQYDADAEWR